MRIRASCLKLLLVFWMLSVPAMLLADDEWTAEVKRYPYRLPDLSVVGIPTWHDIRPKQTMLDIARYHGLGYNDVELLYPRLDPWVPPREKRMTIPSFWVLPPTQHQQLLINVPELRLYFFDKATSTVQTYPIGIGDEGWETPVGTFKIVEKRPNPTWYIPESLQAKYGMKTMPPGPENPLGEYVMKFSAGPYGIHGTHMPWGVGRLVSHGCIRCYPEHIRLLYPQVKVGATLEIIYEPLKFGLKDGQIFVEAHPDVYKKIPDYFQYAQEKLDRYPWAEHVDRNRFQMAVQLRSGVPINVTLSTTDDMAHILAELALH